MMQNKELLSQVSDYKILNVLIFLICYGMIFFIQYNKLSIVVFFIFVLGVFLAIINRRNGILYYIFVIFIFDDLPYDLNLEFTSIDTFMLFGQTTTKLWTLFWVVLIIIDFLSGKKKSIKKDLIHFTMIIIFIISLIIGILRGNLVYISPFINDFRFFINFFVGFYGIFLYVKSKNELYSLFKVLGLVFLAKLTVLTFNTILISRDSFLSTITGDTGLVLAPTFFLIYYILLIKKKSQLVLISAILLTSLSFGLSASRGRILILFLQVFLFFYATGKLKRLPIFIGAMYLVFLIIPFISKDIYAFFIWKLTTFMPSKGVGESSFVRIIEYKNIIGQNLKSIHEFIFGQGLGGSWSSRLYKYPFRLIGTTSYPTEWIRNDRFFKPHGIIQYIILKFGIGGFFLIYGVLIREFFTLKIKLNRYKTNNYSIFTFALFTGVCMLFVISYSSKHQLFLGVFLGTISLFKNEIFQKKELI